MPLQRARGAESRVRNRLSNGPLRVQSNACFTQSILQRAGIRQLPGICWYPVRAQAIVKQGGTAGSVNDPSLTEADSVMGGFFVPFQSLWRDSLNE